VITTPGIKIEPIDKDKPVYLIGNDGPVITIDLPQDDSLVLNSLIILR
jgi:hypothetical protein